jgi:hypothetical protein
MVRLLMTETDEAWEIMRSRLEGLSDDEFLWEPAPGCWTVRLDQDGRWIEDYADPAPEPPPFTTIAWRLVHVAACKIMYHEYAFGPARLTWGELDIPHTAAGAITWLEEGHARLRAALEGFDDDGLEESRPTNWGELWPAWRIFWTMVLHDLHHGAEIGCLRDLYQATRSTERKT